MTIELKWAHRMAYGRTGSSWEAGIHCNVNHLSQFGVRHAGPEESGDFLPNDDSIYPDMKHANSPFDNTANETQARSDRLGAFAR